MKELDKKFKLSDLPKHNVYKVPEGYFERLPMRVMERTAGAGEPEQAWFAAVWKPVRVAMAPLLLLAMFVGVYLFNVPSQPQPFTNSLSYVGEAEIVDYLSNDIYLETADFAELAIANQEMTVDFLNISSASAERELDYYQLADLAY